MLKKGKELIVKSSDIITCKDNFPLRQSKILSLIISKVDPYQENIPVVRLTPSEIKKRLRFTKLSDKDIRNICDDVFIAQTIYRNPNNPKKWMKFHWFEACGGEDGADYIEFKFTNSAKPHLTGLKKFTQIDLEYFLFLKSTHSQKLYERLLSVKFRKVYEVALEDFKEEFDLNGKTTYNETKYIKKYVVQPSVKEINEKTDLYVEFSVKKSGRSVVGYKFDIKLKKECKPLEILPEEGAEEVQIELDRLKKEYTTEKLNKEYAEFIPTLGEGDRTASSILFGIAMIEKYGIRVSVDPETKICKFSGRYEEEKEGEVDVTKPNNSSQKRNSYKLPGRITGNQIKLVNDLVRETKYDELPVKVVVEELTKNQANQFIQDLKEVKAKTKNIEDVKIEPVPSHKALAPV